MPFTGHGGSSPPSDTADCTFGWVGGQVEDWMTPESRCSPELLAALKGVTAKRPRTVIDHILKHGYITTTELKDLYGYDHPPRAAGDVKDAGIPLLTKTLVVNGRRVGHYYFGDPSQIVQDRIGGRTTFSKAFRQEVVGGDAGPCGICGHVFADRYLQIDHRVPYAVAGEPSGPRDASDYMPLCRECQRRKSWSCEGCKNFHIKNSADCATCFWASPDDYTHAALRQERRVDLVWSDADVRVYERLERDAGAAGMTLRDYIHGLLGD